MTRDGTPLRSQKSEWELTDALSAVDEFRHEWGICPTPRGGLFIVGPICDEIGVGPPVRTAPPN
jgi:hypothetical protein